MMPQEAKARYLVQCPYSKRDTTPCAWIWIPEKPPTDVRSCPHCGKIMVGHPGAARNAKPIINLNQRDRFWNPDHTVAWVPVYFEGGFRNVDG